MPCDEHAVPHDMQQEIWEGRAAQDGPTLSLHEITMTYEGQAASVLRTRAGSIDHDMGQAAHACIDATRSCHVSMLCPITRNKKFGGDGLRMMALR